MHLNDNILCVVDTETTGLRAGFHDIIQVCILPLDSNLVPLKEHKGKSILPFYMEIKPKRPESIGEWKGSEFKITDNSAMRVNKLDIFRIMQTAIDPDRAADLLDAWFEKFNFPYGKKISVLAQNWPFDREFLIDWLGHESFGQYFDRRYRDASVAALFCNDQADLHNERCPFPKVNLEYLASTLKVDHRNAHDAMNDCLVTAEVYRRMLKHHSYLRIPDAVVDTPSISTGASEVSPPAS